MPDRYATVSLDVPVIAVSISSWLQRYRAGATPQSLLPAVLEHARSSSPPGVWITLASDDELAVQLTALDRVATALPDCDARLAAYPLFGVPFAVKDNIDIADVPTTAACPAASRVPIASAGAVQRLRGAGAVWIGKTNLDQFATGLVGTRSPYGRPASVFSNEHISGGSSSGSAVSVAAGLVAFALGTDTAGSGRVPAGFNQLVGLKPTPGRVGTSGVLPACRTLDCVSVFALSVAEAAHVLAVIEGPDADDDYSSFVAGVAELPSRALRIGVLRTPELGDGYAQPYQRAVQRLRMLGHAVVDIDFGPLDQVAGLLYSGPWVAERHAAMQELLASAPQEFDPSVRAVVSTAAQFSATDAFNGHYELRRLQRQLAALWTDIDLLMVPTASFHPRFADVERDPIGVNNALGRYTNFVNLLEWCALALPADVTVEGLPFGVTFIAPGNADAALARFGLQWEASVNLPPGGPAIHAAAATRTSDSALRWPAAAPALDIAVVGAHLSGMPLNAQLRERDATLVEATTTAPRYRLFALPDTTPPKPGLVRSDGGERIAVEVWRVPEAQVGSFLRLIPPPLGLGSLELTDGRWVHGFICEPYAVARATDITRFGGWRAYVSSLTTTDVRTAA